MTRWNLLNLDLGLIKGVGGSYLKSQEENCFKVLLHLID